MKTIVFSTLAFCIVSVFSCKKFEKTVNNTVGDNDEGTITASIDGNSYTAPTVSAGQSNTVLFFNSSDFSNDEGLSFRIDGYDGTAKTYDFDLYNTTATYSDKSGNSHRATSGQIIIESAGNATATGSFSFETEDGIKVTDGHFDLNWK